MPRLKPDFEMWFDVPEEHGPGRCLFRFLPDGELARIYNRATDARTTFTERGPQRTTRHDLEKEMVGVITSSLVAWEDFTDNAGEDLPCEDKYKLAFAREGWFLDYVKDSRAKLADARAALEEEKAKN